MNTIDNLMKLATEYSVCYKQNTGFTASREALRAALVEALAQPSIVGTKTWFEDGKMITQNLTSEDVYKTAQQIDTSQEHAQKSAENVHVQPVLEQNKNSLRQDDGRCGLCGGDWSVCGCQGMVNRRAAQPAREPLSHDVVRALWQQTLEATKGPLPIEEFAAVLAKHYGIGGER